MLTRFANLGRCLIAGLLVCAPATSDAADSRQLRQRGKVVLQENCGRCHAIEAAGESPLKRAPPMRDIYARFSPRELQAELSEGMVSKHRETSRRLDPSRVGVFNMPNIDTN
jgi:mono/diheme cytochrome c family protein